MHELSICTALLAEVERIAGEREAAAVTGILLRIGPLSGVEPDLLQNAWPIASAGSVAGNAELVIEPSAIVVHCSQCGRESSATANRLLCAQCGDYRTRIVSGDELILQRIELVTTPDANVRTPGSQLTSDYA